MGVVSLAQLSLSIASLTLQDSSLPASPGFTILLTVVDVFVSNQFFSKDTLAKYLPRIAPPPLFSATHEQKDSPVTDSGLGVPLQAPARVAGSIGVFSDSACP